MSSPLILSLLLIQIYFRDPATDCFILMVLLFIFDLWEIFIIQINDHNLHICLDSPEAVYPLLTVLLINFFVQHNRDNVIPVHAQKKPNVVKCVP